MLLDIRHCSRCCRTDEMRRAMVRCYLARSPCDGLTFDQSTLPSRALHKFHFPMAPARVADVEGLAHGVFKICLRTRITMSKAACACIDRETCEESTDAVSFAFLPLRSSHDENLDVIQLRPLTHDNKRISPCYLHSYYTIHRVHS
jgi:hypothetical protein